jgi:competence protein ComEC
MKGRHVKHVLLFFLVLLVSFLRIEKDREYLPDDLGSGSLMVSVEGVPQEDERGLKVKVKLLGGDMPEVYGKVGYLTLFGAGDVPSRNFEVFGHVKVHNGKVFISSSWKDIKRIILVGESLRDKLIKRMEEKIKDTEVKALLLSYLFGAAQDVMPFEYQASFWRTGLLHLLVVSGFHLTLIALILKHLLPGRYGFFLALLGVSWYAFFVVPMDPPVLRAYLMLLFAILIKLLDRRPDYLSLLFFSGYVILSLYPEYLTSYSFWLSFSATLYLILSGMNTNGIKNSMSERFYPIFISFWSTFFAFLGTASIVSTLSLTTPASVLFTPIVGLLFVPFTAYGILEVLTFFSLPSFPLEWLGKAILSSVSLLSYVSLTVNTPLSVEEAVLITLLSAFMLYFLKNWWKLLAGVSFMPFLLRSLL